MSIATDSPSFSPALFRFLQELAPSNERRLVDPAARSATAQTCAALARGLARADSLPRRAGAALDAAA